MNPPNLQRQIDEMIETNVDIWIEEKYREPEQLDLIDDQGE